MTLKMQSFELFHNNLDHPVRSEYTDLAIDYKFYYPRVISSVG